MATITMRVHVCMCSKSSIRCFQSLGPWIVIPVRVGSAKKLTLPSNINGSFPLQRWIYSSGTFCRSDHVHRYCLRYQFQEKTWLFVLLFPWWFDVSDKCNYDPNTPFQEELNSTVDMIRITYFNVKIVGVTCWLTSENSCNTLLIRWALRVLLPTSRKESDPIDLAGGEAGWGGSQELSQVTTACLLCRGYDWYARVMCGETKSRVGRFPHIYFPFSFSFYLFHIYRL
jgi:hypothetical protein